ncbi:MAG: tetratricopeptide repeat protein, partial [Terriglobales bacterium]
MFLKALRLCPDSAEAWHGVGRYLRNLPKLQDALVAFNRAVQLNPEMTKAWWSIGTTNAGELKNQQAADQAFRRVLTTHPKDLEGMMLISEAYLRLGDVDKSESWIRKSMAAYPNATWPWTNQASIYLSRGDRKSAERAYEQAMNRNPNTRDA